MSSNLCGIVLVSESTPLLHYKVRCVSFLLLDWTLNLASQRLVCYKTSSMSQQPWSFRQWFADLPAIDVSTLEHDSKTCGICCETYSPEDQPLRLSCSHVLGSHCLKKWLGPSWEGGANRHTCP